MAAIPRPRRFLAAVTVSSALLLATACGGGSGSIKDSMESDSPSSSASSSAKPKPTGAKSPTGSSGATDNRLESVILTQDDMADQVTVSSFTPSDNEAVADKKACQPVLDLLAGGVNKGRDEGHASNRYEFDGQESQINVILLASYAPGDAEKFMNDGVDALADCEKFTADAPGTTQTVTYETRQETLKSSADATAGIELTTSAEGDTIPTAYAIIRVGDLLAIFINLDQQTREAEFPDRKLLDLQAEKMRAALKN
ncbi:hypothetical protein [Yinghuangia sp. YIM S10712]|uniref:hypothetical protein n=1 Tax=Yinghuangia sp. YIM S10712 TaxID=3436930 RepID=UPI003F535012